MWTLLSTFTLSQADSVWLSDTLPPGVRFLRFSLNSISGSSGMYAALEDIDISTEPDTSIRSTRWIFKGFKAVWDAPDSGIWADRRLRLTMLPVGATFEVNITVEYELGQTSPAGQPTPNTIELLGAEPVGAANEAKLAAITSAKLYTDLAIADVTPQSLGVIESSEKGQPSGIATLGTDGKVVPGQLPAPSSGGGTGLTQQQVIDLIDSYLDPSQTKFWSQATVINGNSLAPSMNSANEFYSVFRQNPGSFTDEIELRFYLPKGNYFLILIANKTSSSGRQQVIFQNPDSGSPSIIGENDLFDVNNQYNIWHYMTFSSLTPGGKIFRFKIVGKNNNSSGYFAEVSRVRVFRQ